MVLVVYVARVHPVRAHLRLGPVPTSPNLEWARGGAYTIYTYITIATRMLVYIHMRVYKTL